MSGSSILVMLNAFAGHAAPAARSEAARADFKLRVRSSIAWREDLMEVLVILVPLALGLGLAGLLAFLWSLKSGQYDDLDGAAWARDRR